MPDNSKDNNKTGSFEKSEDNIKGSETNEIKKSSLDVSPRGTIHAVKRALVKTGVVVSDKMHKTIIVRLDRVTRDAVYKKVVSRSQKVKAHDGKNIAKTGDVVKIVQTRPLSKDKRWRLLEVVKK